MKLTSVQRFVKKMTANHEGRKRGHFEIIFPSDEEAQLLVDFLSNGGFDLEYSLYIANLELLTDLSTLAAYDDKDMGRMMGENKRLAAEQYIDEVKEEIEEIEATQEFAANDPCDIEAFKRSRDMGAES